MPVDAVAILREIPRVNNRRSAPCDMQREVAVQNSAIESAIGGKPVTYAAPCDLEGVPPSAPSGHLPLKGGGKSEPKTS